MNLETKFGALKKMADQKKDGKVDQIFEIQEMKQTQSVLNLETMGDEDITVTTKKIVFKADVPVKAQLDQLLKMVHPAEKQVDALSRFFTSESYQESKTAALAKGKYMTASLRSQITSIMKNLPAFAEVSAKDCFSRWLDGYKKKTPAAVKLLDLAQATTKEDELSAGL